MFKDQIGSLESWLKLALLLLPWLVFYLLIPPFHIPDEYSHYTYIQALAHGNYPYLTKADCWSQEVHFFADQYKDDNTTIVYAPRVNQPVPADLDDSAVCSTQAQHPPLYYSVATLIYRIATFFGITGIERYNLVRLASLGFFILFLAAADRLFALFFDKKLASWMRLLLIFQPLVLSLATNVNPEMAVIALATTTLYYLSLFLFDRRFSLRQVMLLALLCVLTFYSKVTGGLMIPLTAFALLLLSQEGWFKKLHHLIVFFGIVAVFIAPYLLWNYHLYGRPLENGLMYLVVETHFPAKISGMMQIFYVIDDVRIGLQQIPGDVGRLDAPVFLELKTVYLFTLLVLFSSGITAAFFTSKTEEKWLTHRWLFALHVMLALAFFGYLGYEYMRLAWLGPLLQARYVFIGLVSFLMFCFYGAFKLLRIEPMVLLKVFFLLSLLHFNLVVLWSIVPRFYL